MTIKNIALFLGPALFALACLVDPPGTLEPAAWRVAFLILWMALWWMTEAIPLTATALLPFLVLPMLGVMSAGETASAYYSPILFLILGGAFIALAIERTGLHRRLAVAIVARAGNSAWSLLFAFMIATALLSTIISNTSSTLIMLPIALAVLAATGQGQPPETGSVTDTSETEVPESGFASALVMGIAFSASIGGLGTLVGSPTNAIAAALINRQLDVGIDFATWLIFGLPCLFIGVPLAAAILVRVHRLTRNSVDVAAARAAIGSAGHWSRSEKRLVPIVALVMLLWTTQPLFSGLLPEGSLTDGTIAIFCALLLFLLPDGSGRPLLVWSEANRAPWGVIMLFGGGLALAEGITASGLAGWLGEALSPLGAAPPLLIAALLVALVVLITEFASNVATASAAIPVIAGLVAATGADPLLLAMPAALAASWGFMLPSGTGPNALAWSTGHIRLPDMLRAGFLLDILGIPLIVLIAWLVSATTA